MTEKDPYDDDEGFPEKAEELCTIDELGNKKDMRPHDEILDNPVAEANFQSVVYRQALDDGMDSDLAQRLYLDETSKKMPDPKKNKKAGKTRFQQMAEEPGIGMDNAGNLNIVGFDQKVHDEWVAKQKAEDKLK